MGEGNWSPIARALNAATGKQETCGRIGKQVMIFLSPSLSCFFSSQNPACKRILCLACTSSLLCTGYKHRFVKYSLYTQCRERWNHHLKPGINKEAWTPDEEELLVQVGGN